MRTPFATIVESNEDLASLRGVSENPKDDEDSEEAANAEDHDNVIQPRQFQGQEGV